MLLSSHIFSLYQRLRAVKHTCKTINQNSFSNIESKPKDAFEKLKVIQREVLSYPSPALFEQEHTARDSSLFLSAAEKIIFSQKSRIRWLAEGDANIGFFSSLG